MHDVISSLNYIYTRLVFATNCLNNELAWMFLTPHYSPLAAIASGANTNRKSNTANILW